MEAVQEVLDQIGSLTGRVNKEQLTSVLKAVVAISRASNGGALTNRARKEELKDLVTAYNQDKTIHIQLPQRLGKSALSAEFSTNLPPRRRPHALLAPGLYQGLCSRLSGAKNPRKSL